MNKAIRTKDNYIKALNYVLLARPDFKALEYHRSSNGKEYLFLITLTGEVIMLDVTKFTERDIFHCISIIESAGTKYVSNLITDPKRKLEIAKEFN